MITHNTFPSLKGLNVVQLQALYGDNPAIAVEMFEEYLKEIPKDLAELEASFGSGDARLLATCLHKLKPGFTYVGLTNIAEQVEALEEACKSGACPSANGQNFLALFSEISASTDLVRQALLSLHAAKA